MNNELKIKRTVAGYPLLFTWEGGEYIDVCWADTGEAFDCINTFMGNEPIPFTRGNLLREIEEWANEDRTYELGEYSLGR